MFSLMSVRKLNSKKMHPLLSLRRHLQKEVIFKYAYGSPERIALECALEKLQTTSAGVPVVIGSEQIFTGDEQIQKMPHNHKSILAKFYYANMQHINAAVRESTKMQPVWSKMDVAERATIWRKCADILEKEDRFNLTAAIMLGQGKMFTEADEDGCRLVDSLRKNATYLEEFSQTKLKNNSADIFSTYHMRPLDGFVAAIGPATSTFHSANLAFCPAIMGNCVLWKPSVNAVLSSFIVYQAMIKAGLPHGVISFLPTNETLFINSITNTKDLAGINYTGRDRGLRIIWHAASLRLDNYICFPRIVGECGAKNFHLVHESASIETVVEETVDAAFRYSGQNCSACSRLYVPKSMWNELKTVLQDEVDSKKISDPTDFTAFTSAVVNEESFDRIVEYLIYAQKSAHVEVIAGGDFCKTLGYFIEPTVLRCKKPNSRLMIEEIAGPVLTVYVYENKDFCQVLELIKSTSVYALCGSIFAAKDEAICQTVKALRMHVSNMYVNQKCIGSISGHPAFSGNRRSGTNDKSGTPFFLMQWCSPQLLEEYFPEN